MAYFLYNINNMKKLLKISSLKYIVAFFLPLIFVMIYNHTLDNDSWDVLAQGRYIFENGIYYTDALSMHNGLNITVQNYAFSVVFYAIYAAFGPAGLYIGMLVLEFLVCVLLYKIYMLLSNKNINLSLFAMILTSSLLVIGFVTTRAQMLSYVIFLGTIYVLELYVKTGNNKFLWWVPLFSLVQINFHASLWPMIFLLLLVYIIDSIRMPKLHLQGYKTWPLVLVGIISFLVGFLNPYGLNMMILMFSSYGDATLMGFVSELQPFDLRSVYNVILYGVTIIILVLCIFGNEKKMKMRFLLMFFGFLALGLNSLKGMSQYILVMFFPLVLAYSDIKIENVIDAKIGRDMVISWCGILAVCLFVAECAFVVPNIKDGPDGVIMEVMDLIEEKNSQKGESGGNVFIGYNDGGYVEYRGYKAYLDPRGEVFLKKNNSEIDILKEYIELRDGKMDLDDLFDKYDFDYIIAEKSDGKIYELNMDEYELIYENNDYKIRVFEAVR